MKGYGEKLKQENDLVGQMELHPLWRQDDVVGFCQSHGIHVSAHTPLGIPGRPDGSREQGGDEEIGSESAQTSPSLHAPMLRISVVAEIASKLGRTPAQVSPLSLICH